jgi:hypothetical protein
VNMGDRTKRPGILQRLGARLLYRYRPPMVMRPRSVGIFLAVTAAVCVLIPVAVAVDIYLGAGFFNEVGPAENLTALAFILAGFLCAMGADAARDPLVRIPYRGALAAQLFLCALVAFLLAVEEATFGREIRVLNELDFRNTTYPVVYWRHVALSSGLLILSTISLALHGRVDSRLFEVAAPHPSLVLPAYVIWVVALARQPAFQEIGGILAALYLAAHAALTLHKLRRLARQAALAVEPPAQASGRLSREGSPFRVARRALCTVEASLYSREALAIDLSRIEKLERLLAITGGLVVIAAALVLLQRDGVTGLATPLLQSYFSRDGVVDERNLGQFRQLLGVAALIGIAAGALFVGLSSRTFRRQVTTRLLHTGAPPFAIPRRAVISLGIGMAAAAMLLPVGFALDLYIFQSGIFREDGPAENLTALLFGLASLACCWLAIETPRRNLGLESSRRAVGLFFALCAVACFFIEMEEISWGQRIIGFDTPMTLRAVNVQGEFNLHNLANPVFFWIYLVASSMVLLVSLTSAYLHGRIRHRAFESLAPHPILTTLALALWGVSLTGLAPFREVVEILAGLYVLCYVGMTLYKVRGLASVPLVIPGGNDDRSSLPGSAGGFRP